MEESMDERGGDMSSPYWREGERALVRLTITENLKQIIAFVEEAKKEFEKDLTPEEVLEQKATFMLRLLNCMPVGYPACPYCVMQHARIEELQGAPDYKGLFDEDMCDGCEYGQVRGICSSKSSNYAKLINAIDTAKMAIISYPLFDVE
jgi:ferredoxin